MPVPPKGGILRRLDSAPKSLQNKGLSIHKPYPEKGGDAEDGTCPPSAS